MKISAPIIFAGVIVGGAVLIVLLPLLAAIAIVLGLPYIFFLRPREMKHERWKIEQKAERLRLVAKRPSEKGKPLFDLREKVN